MSTHAARLSWSLLVGLLLATPALAAPTAGQSKPEQPKTETAAEKVRKALDQVTSVEFQATTLTVAMETLREQTKVNFVIDRSTIQMMGISPDDAQINLKLGSVKLRTVLKHLLSQYNLTYVIDGDILLITTEQMAIEKQMRQRVSVDFDKMPLDQALKQLVRDTGASNLVIDHRHVAKIKDTVTLKLEDVPLETAVRLIAEVAGLRSVRLSNVLFVTSPEVAAKLIKEENDANHGTPSPNTPPYVDPRLWLLR